MLLWRSALVPEVSLAIHPPPFSPPEGVGQRVRQVHGARVVAAPSPGRPEGDAILLTGPGSAWVGVADCLAVALVGPLGCVLLHAGWRGLAAGVAEAGSEAVGGAVEAVASPHATAAAYTFDPALARREFGDLGERALATGPEGATLSLLTILEGRLGFAPVALGGCTLTDRGWASRRGGGRGPQLGGTQMAIDGRRCAGCGTPLAGEDAVAAAGVLLCLACARESGWAKRRAAVSPVAAAAAVVLVAALALPWEGGAGGGGLVHIKWLVGLSGLFLVALSNVRTERTSALFLLGPLALLGVLVLHWFTVEKLRPWQEGRVFSPGLMAATAGVLLVAWALWREPKAEPPPPTKE